MNETKKSKSTFAILCIRRVAYTFVFLFVAYVLSIGPVYAYLFRKMDRSDYETTARVMDLYSPLYFPCRNNKLDHVFGKYIGYWFWIIN